MKFHLSQEQRNDAQMKFRNGRNHFEGALGAIDCTFVNILAPIQYEHAYVNHHGRHSLNIQAVEYLYFYHFMRRNDSNIYRPTLVYYFYR